MANCHHHNCLEDLSADHKRILEKLSELGGAVNTAPTDENKVKEFLHFTETFVEPHLQKEEKVLFPALESKGMPREGGPIGMMLFEHQIKRGYVKDLQKALEGREKKKITEVAKVIISVLSEHIDKEENILYPWARDFLAEEELVALSHQCEKIK